VFYKTLSICRYGRNTDGFITYPYITLPLFSLVIKVMANLRTTNYLRVLLHSPYITVEGEQAVYRLKVKEVAQQKQMSQRQLFFRSHVDLKIIQRIYREPSKTVVTIETLDKLAMALDVDISELVESIHTDEAPPAMPH
jgi:DNA-binding Xre family transcriptional regulator